MEAIAIYKDHSNMVKFMSAEDEGYRTLSGHMLLMAESATAQIRARWASYEPVERRKTP